MVSKSAKTAVPERSDDATVDGERRRGRGARSNHTGRFETERREEVDDGWEGLGDLEAFKTEVYEEPARTIITRNDSPDIAFDRSINPYRGCEHGCIYCYARPTHCYLGLLGRPRLRDQALSPRRTPPSCSSASFPSRATARRRMALGTNTDPYQPIERERQHHARDPRGAGAHLDHPVGIVTKSALITRDIDILARMAKRGLARVALSVTTLDRKLARAMEPRAATPAKRLDAVAPLSDAGIPTTVMVGAVIPGLNDPEIERILETRAKPPARVGRLRAAAPAARDQGAVPRMAGDRVPRPRRARHPSDAIDARRPRLHIPSSACASAALVLTPSKSACVSAWRSNGSASTRFATRCAPTSSSAPCSPGNKCGFSEVFLKPRGGPGFDLSPTRQTFPVMGNAAAELRPRPTFELEAAELQLHGGPVAGVDEAGRGPLAGPVVAAAVILDPQRIPDGINDSKVLDEETREILFVRIRATAIVGVGMADVKRIDRQNILHATMWAMAQAVAQLAVMPKMVAIDGNRAPKLKCPARTIVKGDARCLSIAAASIIAKVTRDRIMVQLAAKHPGYGFERHKGYSTPEHHDAIRRLGVTDHHRRSFRTVQLALGLIEEEAL